MHRCTNGSGLKPNWASTAVSQSRFAAEELILNKSFESPVIDADGSQLNQVPTDWLGENEDWGSIYLKRNDASRDSGFGSNYVTLVGSSTSLTQFLFSLTPERSYRIN